MPTPTMKREEIKKKCHLKSVKWLMETISWAVIAFVIMQLKFTIIANNKYKINDYFPLRSPQFKYSDCMCA